jgi:hypothetical protein
MKITKITFPTNGTLPIAKVRMRYKHGFITATVDHKFALQNIDKKEKYSMNKIGKVLGDQLQGKKFKMQLKKAAAARHAYNMLDWLD